MGTLTLLAVSVAVAPSAHAECSARRSYTITNGGYWDNYEALLVPPSTGPVTQTITTTRTHSSDTTVSAEVGISAQAFIAEINTKFGGSYAVTATVAKGQSTQVTAPPADSNQEIRFGTFKEKIQVDLIYYGCSSGPPSNTTFVFAAKTAAGVVKV